MSRFKPQVTYMTRESWNNYCSSYKSVSKYITKQYNTYRELKKELKEICEKNIDADGVHVVRSKRGEWGEWNEYWKLDYKGKPMVTEVGWS